MSERSSNLPELLFQLGKERRWTQDSPIMPDVWDELARNPGKRVDLLVTPYRGTRPGLLAEKIRRAIERESSNVRASWTEECRGPAVAHNASVVAVCANFEELVTILAPMSRWFQETIGKHLPKIRKYRTRGRVKGGNLKRLREEVANPNVEPDEFPLTVVWWLRLLGQISLLSEDPGALGNREKAEDSPESQANLLEGALRLLPRSKKSDTSIRIFRISSNRRPKTSCVESIRTVKADAAERVFQIDTQRICWAVLDTGIDARHPAFNGDKKITRVRETYDFTRIRRLVWLASTPGDEAEAKLGKEFAITTEQANRIRTGLAGGGEVDWDTLKPALSVKHTTKSLNEYTNGKNGVSPIHPHGTHVAGILAGRAQETDDGDFVGMCPEIRLIDLRVLDGNGQPGEFDIIAALQFIRYLNSASDELVVHGVNMSIQLKHDPRNFACGQTPVCEECERLVSSGVVVVASAGNYGIDREAAVATTHEGAFRDITIADPGNAETVITVGSTHRKRPHEYGVSFFSSRGPTGDGRGKPDLVAPGERILSAVLKKKYKRLDGTSQAAPHVSGAAALLMARHSELVGDPMRVKQILCGTATDLGRERFFQGRGLLDILRALQSM